MIAWVSPGRIVSVTPLRISLGPSSVSTLTCRSRISRVVSCGAEGVLIVLFSSRWSSRRAAPSRGHGCSRSGVVERVLEVDEQVVALDLDRVDGDRLEGRERRGLAGAQVEGRAVQPALDVAALHVALRQGDRGVGALVVDGVEVVAVADERQVGAVDGDGVRLAA